MPSRLLPSKCLARVSSVPCPRACRMWCLAPAQAAAVVQPFCLFQPVNVPQPCENFLYAVKGGPLARAAARPGPARRACGLSGPTRRASRTAPRRRAVPGRRQERLTRPGRRPPRCQSSQSRTQRQERLRRRTRSATPILDPPSAPWDSAPARRTKEGGRLACGPKSFYYKPGPAVIESTN